MISAMPATTNRWNERMLAFLGLIASTSAVLVGLAQSQIKTATVPKFDAASIKPCLPTDGAGGGRDGKNAGGASYMSSSPGRINITCFTVSSLIDIYLQYGDEPLTNDSGTPFETRRIRGGPPWMYSDRYTISAVTTELAANGPTGRGSRSRKLLNGSMLQALLEDRFHLKTHREMEEVPAYSLTVAKGGLKLKPTEHGSCNTFEPGKSLEGELAPGDKQWCITHVGWDGPNWTLDVDGKGLSDVASALGGTILGRPVIDRTGVTELFTFHLVFAHDESAPGNLPPDFNPFTPTDDPSGPSVFTALEKLGLKLVPDKAPRGYLVIDHVERPSEN
jgi:uncharacterized protein (TIGR03435 family)